MPYLDRTSFIELLDTLGDPDDAKALAAAREIHRRVKATEQEWDALLTTAPGTAALRPLDEYDDPDVDIHEFDIRDVENGVALDLSPVPPEQAAEFAEELSLIDALLGRHGVSTETRRELADLRNDIASGDFSDRDRIYLRDLTGRLERLHPAAVEAPAPEPL
ncbi:conserved hypothetical protein [Azospirillaceae bacterium]